MDEAAAGAAVVEADIRLSVPERERLGVDPGGAQGSQCQRILNSEAIASRYCACPTALVLW